MGKDTRNHDAHVKIFHFHYNFQTIYHMPTFRNIFYEVTALGQRWSVRAHSFIHEYTQFDLFFRTIYHMPTFPKSFYEVTVLGQRWSVRSTRNLAYAKRLDLIKKMSYHSWESVEQIPNEIDWNLWNYMAQEISCNPIAGGSQSYSNPNFNVKNY